MIPIYSFKIVVEVEPSANIHKVIEDMVKLRDQLNVGIKTQFNQTELEVDMGDTIDDVIQRYTDDADETKWC